MGSKSSRYQSRILREMHQYNEHPFSPPSSTGSHGTVTLTSNLTLGPQGESTRRMDDVPTNAAMRNSKAPQPSALNINTSALARTFPEWSRWNPDSPEHEKDMWESLESNDGRQPSGDGRYRGVRYQGCDQLIPRTARKIGLQRHYEGMRATRGTDWIHKHIKLRHLHARNAHERDRQSCRVIRRSGLSPLNPDEIPP